MKKFLLFTIVFTVNVCLGQNVPSANNFTEISSNYRADMGSGNFVYSVPLFDIETMNPNFGLQGNLYYNAQAASSIFTAEGILAKGWAADFLPSIYRDINQINSLCDELYYKTDTYSVNGDYQPYSRPYRDKNDLFEFSIFGLRGSFRLAYNSDNTVDVKLVSSNAFVEIIPDCPMSNNGINGKIINLNGFTIKDSNGFSYRFDTVEDSGLWQNLGDSYSLLIDPAWNTGRVNAYLPYKRSFLLSNITDKYQRTLVQYIYKTYPYTLGAGSTAFNYNQKVIDKIKIINKSNLVFTTNQSKITSIAINDYVDQPISKINLAASNVIFTNQNNIEEKRYQFLYFPSTYYPNIGTPTNNQGNYIKADKCATASSSWIYDNKIQNYSAGLLRSITIPQKGKINIEYETNTYNFSLAGIWSQLNYDYVEVPVTYNSANDSYSFFYSSIAGGNDEAFYVKFHSTLYTNPLLVDGNGNPLSVYPGFRIFTLNTPPTLWQGFAFEDQCTYGERINHAPDFNNKTIVLKRHSGTASNISNVKVYKKIIKPQNQRVGYCFGPSVRVKKITNMDGVNTVNEKVYSYNDPANDKMSSGVISNLVWYQYLSPQIERPTTIFYKYITVEETGKGKMVCQMNWEGAISDQFKPDDPAYNPKNIWKYNDAGELVEHQNNTFETYLVSSDSESYHKIKKINSTIKSYEGINFKTTTNEKVLDTISMLPLYNKIVEASTGQTFEEHYTIQKLGNAFYQTNVEKTKNSEALNQSAFTYQQQGSTQAYNLYQTSVAKEVRPLEVEREITLYDDYGNVLEYKTKEGLIVSQIWGYNDSKLVAELKNIPYASINQPTITAVKTNSNVATYNEAALVILLNGLRGTHTTGYVTTYIYRPLVGIASITDVNGRKESYVYDDFNRLYRIFNNEGLIIKEYQYHIKPN
ncbi:MAG: hypothetical protein RSF34_18570 [Flavobacterium sp.]|uniref:hypothetical protein n=1 Tax=Flavobacterium sp. TaxID=239 RepID=UPI002FCAA109